jgi:hypothetical protein
MLRRLFRTTDKAVQEIRLNTPAVRFDNWTVRVIEKHGFARIVSN